MIRNRVELRDFFAAAALASIAVKGIYEDEDAETIAAAAYMLADAMMAERDSDDV